MAPHFYWFLIALGLLALEMTTGTFYMLVLAIAFGIGGLAGLLGAALPLQIVFSAITAIAGTLYLRHARRTRPADHANQSLEINEPVHAVTWRADGSGRAQYRGSEWDAEAESPDMPREGPLYIKAMRGSTLILTHRKP